MNGLIRAACALSVVVGLGGCATMRGAPKSVFDASALVEAARKYDIATVDTALKSGDATAKQQYRNKVIRAYLAAIDARYYQFRTNLGIEGRGGNLGFDTALLGLTSAGALWASAASELAAGSAFLAGSRSGIDKNLLYEKTLPAIFASMDAARLRQRTLILQRMDSDIGSYPIEAAWGDLQAYQVAGTFDDAVTQITESAASDRAEARATYNRSLGLACDSTQELLPQRQRVGDMLRAAYIAAETGADASAKAQGRLRMEQIAQAFDVTTRGSNDELRDAVLDMIELDYCSIDTLRGRIDRLLP